MGNYRGGASASKLRGKEKRKSQALCLSNVKDGDAELTPNDTASTALCSSILITSKSPLRLTGTNENLVINYEYPAGLGCETRLFKTKGDIRQQLS